MNYIFLSPFEVLKFYYSNYRLIATLSLQQILAKYKASVFGILWAFIMPMSMVIIYSFIFTKVFTTKWSSNSENPGEYALMLYLGLIVFNTFSDVISRSVSLIPDNILYIKKIVFPIEILPIVLIIVASFNAFIGLIFWLIAFSILIGFQFISLFDLIFFWLSFMLFIGGISLILAALGAYIRDLNHGIGLSLSMLMFLSPIFYSNNDVPYPYNLILMVNPLAIFIDMFRKIMYFHSPLDYTFLLFTLIGSFLIFIFGFNFFRKLKIGFSDIL